MVEYADEEELVGEVGFNVAILPRDVKLVRSISGGEDSVVDIGGGGGGGGG